MKRFLVLLFCCAVGFSLFAGKEKTHSILFFAKEGELQFISNESTTLLESKQSTKGKHWYRSYFLAGKEKWEEIRIVVRPTADGKLEINLRAPGGSVAEYASFTINGKEMLEETAVIPYANTKKQKGVWIKYDAEKDKDIVITAKIRRSPRALSEFDAAE